jgi:transcriptional/translational regulatory protein YebC/TACO1
LAQVIADAKVANVPKDIITRNIEKASAAATADFKESVFEFYGHGGVGLLVNVLTDNDNRANADVNLVAKKNLLKAAAANSVRFKFEKKARLDVAAVLSEDRLMEICLESGVDDYDLVSCSVRVSLVYSYDAWLTLRVLG